MKVYKIEWSENKKRRSYNVIVNRIDELFNKLDGFKLDNLISISLVHLGDNELLTLDELNRL